jgi:GT2 family glycosyltransferase
MERSEGEAVSMQGECVAVVVVTYNSEHVLGGLVSSLPSGLRGVDWSLTIVDNGSDDDTVATAHRLAPEATVIATGRNGGYAAGINIGIAASVPHTAVLVLNPDVRLGAGCVAELLTALRRPGVGIVAPRLVDRNGELIESQRRVPTIARALGDALLGARRAGRIGRLGEVVTDPRAYTTPRPTDWAEGSTLLVSAECLAACGPWDETFFLYSEETEFALRAADHGFATVFVPSASAVHLEGDSAGSPSLWPLLVTNRVRLYRRRHGRTATAVFWGVVTVREGSRAAMGRATSRAAFASLVSPARMRARPGPDWVAARNGAHVSATA